MGSTITHRKIFYINSKNRIAGTNSRFTFSLPFYPSDNFDRVAVLQCTIPKSFYLIKNGLNTFTLTEGAFITTITIPVGNYTRRSLQDTLQTLLNNASSGITYTVSWPSSTEPLTGKFTFTCSNFGGIQPIFTFDSIVAEPLGFDINSTNQFSNFSLTSANVINLQAENVIYLHSDICTNGNDDILQEIFVTGDPSFANVTFQNFDVEAYSKVLVSKSKNCYYFYLTDEDGNEIDLNGVGMNVTLILYTYNNYFQMQKEFIKYQLLKEGAPNI